MKFGPPAFTIALVAAAVAAPAFADPAITNFVMVDADSNEDYEEIVNGGTMYEDNIPKYCNVRANYDENEAIPGSVQFFVNGAGPVRTENQAPFALAGDTPPGYYYVDTKYITGPGNYTLKAIPFESKNAGGAEYAPTEVTFTIEAGDEPIIAHEDTCFTDFAFSTDERCNVDTLLALLDAEIALVPACTGSNSVAELGFLLGEPGASEEKLRELFAEICEDALDIHYGFNEVMGANDVFVTEYFNGGTYWNEGRQSFGINGKPSDKLKGNPGRKIKNFYNGYAQNRPMIWPSEITNFNPDEKAGDSANCEARAAMCCWVQDRQANDDNGNCAEKYDENCVDADPADNTDICFHDMSESPESARVADGDSLFVGDDDDGEGAAHCHGFAWNDDGEDLGYLYRANNLFFVSMYDHLYTRGYVRNVPGAPMCACIEQMPTVSRSDCTQIDEVDVSTDYTYNENGNFEFVVETDIEIEFNACQASTNNDLYTYYKEEINADAAAQETIDRKLVGPVDNNEPSNCGAAIKEYLGEKHRISFTDTA